jgi:glycosyltransferase involved in cell wall biosynthesis
MTRVLHVTECYAGGVSRAILAAINLTPDVEHHLLWSGDESPPADGRFTTMTSLPKALPSAVRRVADVVQRLRPDVVHAHSSWAGVFTRARDLGTPVVYQPHCYKFADLGQPAVLRHAYRLAEKALASRASQTLVLSPHEDQLAKSLHRRAETVFLPNVATALPDPEHLATDFRCGRDVIMIGRLSRQKDPAFFAAVAHAVRARRPDVTFRWIGDGDAKERRRLVSAGVEVTGWLDGEELRRELAQPSLYLHSAHYEGFPLSVLDAAAFEHPLIARDIPALEGFAVPVAQTIAGVADLVVDALNGGPTYRRACDAARTVSSAMVPARQQEALRRVYDRAMAA